MKSIGTRLAVVITSVLLVLILAEAIWTNHQIKLAVQQDKVVQSETHAQTLLASLQTLMLNGQGTLARTWLERMQGAAGIIDIAIIRQDGKEAFTDLSTVNSVNDFIETPRFSREPVMPREGKILSDRLLAEVKTGKTAFDFSTHGELTLALPIRAYNECMACHGYEDSPFRGYLKLTVSTEETEDYIENIQLMLWTISGVIVLLLTLALWTAMKINILRPVKDLQQAIFRAKQGDRSAKLLMSREDEFGEVAVAFNEMQENLLASEAKIRAVMDNVDDAILTISLEGIIESVNPATNYMFDYIDDELVGVSITRIIPEVKVRNESFSPDYLNQVREGGVRHELVAKKKAGVEFPVEITVSDMRLNDKEYLIGIVRDITERKAQTEALEYQALHDSLTGLPNRSLLGDRLRQAILDSHRYNHSLALMIMDLDHFKEINDTLGHHCGDLLLQQVSSRVRHALRGSDTVARLGGDEFAVLLPNADSVHAETVAKKILGAFHQPFHVEGHQLEVGASIGISMSPSDGEDVMDLMRRADVAMYAAKRSRSGYQLYHPTKESQGLQQLKLFAELQRAADAGQLELYFQPRVRTDNSKVVGVEALIRWHHPEHGLMLPEEFISLAEEHGLAGRLTLWVMSQVFLLREQWWNRGINIDISFNISAKCFEENEFLDDAAALIREYEKLIEGVRIEITETALMADPDRAMDFLKRVGQGKLKMSIDDFGTGYSSLAYLKQLPVDEIKIDKSFLLYVSRDDDTVILRSMIDLAHKIGLSVVAEGVETEEAFLLVKEFHCDTVQGFHVCEPLPVEPLMAWLKYQDKYRV